MAYSNKYRSRAPRTSRLPPTPVSNDERTRIEKFCEHWRIPMAQAIRGSLVCSGILEDGALEDLNLPARIIAYMREHRCFPPISAED